MKFPFQHRLILEASDAHINLRRSFRRDHIGSGTAVDEAGVDGYAFSQIGKFLNTQNLPR